MHSDGETEREPMAWRPEDDTDDTDHAEVADGTTVRDRSAAHDVDGADDADVAAADVRDAALLDHESDMLVTGSHPVVASGPRVTAQTEAAPEPLLDDEPRALAPAIVTLWRIELLITWTTLGAIGAGAFVILRGLSQWPQALGVLAAGMLLGLALAARLPGRRYRAWRVQLAPDGLRLARGVLVRRTTLVPYTRVQHVDTQQGPIERLLGLASVTAHTAAGSDATVTIPGLLPGDADAMRERLAELAGRVEAV